MIDLKKIIAQADQQIYAQEIGKIDAWLNDPNAEVPPMKEAVAQLAVCDPMEVSKRRKEIAKRLGVDVPTLRAQVKEQLKLAKKVQPPREPNAGQKKAICYAPGDLETAIPTAENVLFDMGLKYFERNRELVHTVYGRDADEGHQKPWKRDENSIIIQQASHGTIVRDLDKLAQFWRPGEEKPIPVHVPKGLPDHLHDRVSTNPRDVPYPTIKMVTTSPVLLPSGAVSEKLFAEGVLYVPRDRKRFLAVPQKPTREEARTALRKFDHIFAGFPFVDPGEHRKPLWTASYSVVLSATLTLIARPYLNFGPVPLHAFNAPSPRSGKSKLAKASTAAALGYLPTAVHFRDEEEFGKHLLPLMRAADRAILIDNIEIALQGAKLNILITENEMRDRILGESVDLTLTNVALFLATGNNLSIKGDLASRSLRSDIDAVREDPEARRFGFDPVQKAQELHPELVVAALTALRAYLLSGAQLEREPWGGFEDWDRLVSGALVWLGYADPYETRARVLESDPTRASNADLLELWEETYGAKEVSLRQIRQDGSEVYVALRGADGWNGDYAAWLLRRVENRVFDGRRLIRCPGRSRFRLEVLGPRASATSAKKEEF